MLTRRDRTTSRMILTRTTLKAMLTSDLQSMYTVTYKPAITKIAVSVAFWPFVVFSRQSSGIGYYSVRRLQFSSGDIFEHTMNAMIASKTQLIPPGTRMILSEDKQCAKGLFWRSQNAWIGMLKDS